MKLPKSSHTGDPLTAVLILYPGKDTRPPKTLGNLSGTYNTLKQYSRSTSNGGISTKTELHGANLCALEPPLPLLFQDCVVQTFVFLSRPSCIRTCRPRPTPLFPA